MLVYAIFVRLVLFVCSHIVCSHFFYSRIVCSRIVCSQIVCSHIVCSRIFCSHLVCSHFFYSHFSPYLVCSNIVCSNQLSLPRVSGTLLSAPTSFCCATRHTSRVRAFFYNLLATALQMLTFLVIVGWIWSIRWGIIMVQLARES